MAKSFFPFSFLTPKAQSFLLFSPSAQRHSTRPFGWTDITSLHGFPLFMHVFSSSSHAPTLLTISVPMPSHTCPFSPTPSPCFCTTPGRLTNASNSSPCSCYNSLVRLMHRETLFAQLLPQQTMLLLVTTPCSCVSCYQLAFSTFPMPPLLHQQLHASMQSHLLDCMCQSASC